MQDMYATIATAEFLVSSDTVPTTADLSADQSVFGHSCHGWTAFSDGQHVFLQHQKGQGHMQLQWEQHNCETTSVISHISWATLQPADHELLAITSDRRLYVCQLRLPAPAVALHASAIIETVKSGCFQFDAIIKALAWHPELCDVLAVATEEHVTVLQVMLKPPLDFPTADDNKCLSFKTLAVVNSKQKARKGPTSLLWLSVNSQHGNKTREDCLTDNHGRHSQQRADKQRQCLHRSESGAAMLSTMLVVCWGGTALEYICWPDLHHCGCDAPTDSAALPNQSTLQWESPERCTITACNDYLINHNVRAMMALPGCSSFLLSCDADLLSHTATVIKESNVLGNRTNTAAVEKTDGPTSGSRQLIDLVGKIGAVQSGPKVPTTQSSAASSTATKPYDMPVQALLNGQLGLAAEKTVFDPPAVSPLAALLNINSDTSKPTIPQSLQLQRSHSEVPPAGLLLLVSIQAEPNGSTSTTSTAGLYTVHKSLQAAVCGTLPLHVPYANLLASVPCQASDTASHINGLRTRQHDVVVAIGSTTTPAFVQIVKADVMHGGLQHLTIIHTTRPTVDVQVAAQQSKQKAFCDPAKLRNRGITLVWQGNDSICKQLSKVHSSIESINKACGYGLVVTALQGEVIVSDQAPPPFTLLRKKGPVTTKLKQLQLSSFVIPSQCISNTQPMMVTGNVVQPLQSNQQGQQQPPTKSLDETLTNQAYTSKQVLPCNLEPGRTSGTCTVAMRGTEPRILGVAGNIAMPSQAVDLQSVLLQLQQMQMQMNTWQEAMSQRIDRLESTMQSVVGLLEGQLNTANQHR